MVIPELEKQLLQLSANDKLYIIQFLAQNLAIPEDQTDRPSKLDGSCVPNATLSDFFRQSPLVGIAEELDFSRDRSLPRNTFTHDLST